MQQLDLPLDTGVISEPGLLTEPEFHRTLVDFSEFGKETVVTGFPDASVDLPVYANEFWTSKQRAAHSLHEISYRACFKPQLPRFFIERLTRPGDTVYDPFMGRGTTLLETALLGRIPAGCDVNPLSRILCSPRLYPPSLDAIARRLSEIRFDCKSGIREDLLVFYHDSTLNAISALREYILEREADGKLDYVDSWIRMVATNRLTGHSPGFFSVYTLPPNQAVSIESQKKINAKRKQTPPARDVASVILRKSHTLLRSLDDPDWSRLRTAGEHARLLTGSCDDTPDLPDSSVHLAVTSPPFLDVVNYQADNWLRGWFNGIDPSGVKIWQVRGAPEWQAKMTEVFRELNRVLVPGGYVAFEVGEVRGGKLLLESLVVPAAVEAGLSPVLVMINDQEFTKTANCWGVDNLAKGTNTNRIVLLRKNP